MFRNIKELPRTTVPEGARGQWCRIRLRLSGQPASANFFVVLQDAEGGLLTESIFLRRHRVGWEALWFVPTEVVFAQVKAIGLDATRPNHLQMQFLPISKWSVARQLLAGRPRRFLDLVRGGPPLTRNDGRHRFRRMLSQAMADENQPGLDYRTWWRLFDVWSFPGSEEGGLPGPTIGYAVFVHRREAAAEALCASLAGIAAQSVVAPHRVLDGSEDDPAVHLAGLGTDYVGILQAGEVLPAHATALASHCLALEGRPELAIADEDELSPAGERRTPLFKPVPNRFLMLTGTLSRGLWLVRADALGAAGPGPTPWAETLRLETWLRRSESAPRGFGTRLPYVLTHRRPDTEAAPPEMLAEVVNAHLGRTGFPMVAGAAWPLRLRRIPFPAAGKVTVIIPSTLRQPHALSCITAVLRRTAYPDLEVHVAVSQPTPLDAAQQEAARQIEAHANTRVTWLPAERFNFSWVNNRIIEQTGSDHVLLLNDDVDPVAEDWLDWMVAYLADSSVGVVGARLLYPSGDVQHGGVIMGLGGLCEHAHRNLPGHLPGYAWRAVLPQELSAVTAACMLVRRSALQAVGGLDERYPSAFNDVDLALRIGELGYAVVYAAQAELVHRELQTYGSHYAGDRQPFQGAEIQRMRHRWAGVCAADPFHNPNLGLEPGREWQLAFPSRIDSWLGTARPGTPDARVL